ncbi:MAG: hypothetical protein LQ338_007162 [Usnochroma carphineum]|nr:MAG: hypothetical protein LQ338_007162 [Usnochroma carphineum]
MKQAIKRFVTDPFLPPFSETLAVPNQTLSRWSSDDLNPVPKSQKKWEWYHIGGFWIAEGFSAAQIQISSAAVALGLNPGLALAAYAIGNLLAAVPCCAAGYIGSKYSINFPVTARAAFGMYGSYLAIVIQAYVGGQAVQAMIEAIWPSFATWHENALPPSADITAPALLSFAIFWTVSLPFLYISPPKLRWLFMAKILTMPFLWVALFTWAITASHGFGTLLKIPNRPQNGVNNFTVNMPDITRYAHSARSSTLAQAIALPVCLTLTYLLGIILTDYYIIRRHIGLNVDQLYTPEGLYWFQHGVNWRAIASFFIGMTPLLPSLVYQISPTIGGIAHNYVNFSSLSYLESTLFASLSYYCFCKVSPFPTYTDAEDKMAWAIQGSDENQTRSECVKSEGRQMAANAVRNDDARV